MVQLKYIVTRLVVSLLLAPAPYLLTQQKPAIAWVLRTRDPNGSREAIA